MFSTSLKTLSYFYYPVHKNFVIKCTQTPYTFIYQLIYTIYGRCHQQVKAFSNNNTYPSLITALFARQTPSGNRPITRLSCLQTALFIQLIVSYPPDSANRCRRHMSGSSDNKLFYRHCWLGIAHRNPLALFTACANSKT